MSAAENLSPEEPAHNAIETMHALFATAVGVLDSDEILLLMYLAVRCGQEGECWATYKQIHRDIKLSTRQLMRLVKVLTSDQRGRVLICLRRKSDEDPRHNLPNIYRINRGAIERLLRRPVKASRKGPRRTDLGPVVMVEPMATETPATVAAPTAMETSAALVESTALAEPATAGTSASLAAPIPLVTGGHEAWCQTVTRPGDQLSPSKTHGKNSEIKPKKEGRARVRAVPPVSSRIEVKTGAAPTRDSLTDWFLSVFRGAWTACYDAPAVERSWGDQGHAVILVRAARAQAEAQQARCSARGEAPDDLEDLARDCLRAQIDAYLATSGRVSDRYPQGFLVFRKHPLSAMVADLELLPPPWAVDEERLKKSALQAQQQAEQQASRARTLEADRARQQRVVRLHAPSLVLASPPAPAPMAAPAPSLAAAGAPGLALAPTPALPLAPAPGAHSSLASGLAANESAPASLPSLPAVAFARHDALTPEQQQQADYQVRLRAALDATERTDLARLEAIPPHERTASQRRWLANLLSRGVLALEALDACKDACT